MDPADRESEQALVARANEGEESALEAIYRRNRDWVVALAMRFTGQEADALDVLQETFATLFGRFPGFELRSSLRAYLYPVVRHTAISVCRKRRRSAPLDADRLPAPEPWSEQENPEGFRSLIAALPGDHREAVWLRFALDLSLEEIAEVQGIPLGTVKSRLHNALKTLRSLVAKE